MLPSNQQQQQRWMKPKYIFTYHVHLPNIRTRYLPTELCYIQDYEAI